jgi:putative aldouronate transport system substrate-binding protein
MQTHFHNGTVASVQDGFGAMALTTLIKIDMRFALDLGYPYGPAATPWQGPGIFGHVTFNKAAPERIKMPPRISDYLSAPFGTKEYEPADYG